MTNTAEMTVEQAIQGFYTKHNFGDDGGVNEKFAWIKFGFFSIPIPNVEGRSAILYMHDISHIITQNDTTWRGESAVSAWEIGSGGWNNLVVPWLLTLWAMGLGVLFYPKSVLKSFNSGLTMRNALTCGLSKAEILNLSVDDLRLYLSNKPSTNKSPFIWFAISFGVFITTFLVPLVTIWAILD